MRKTLPLGAFRGKPWRWIEDPFSFLDLTYLEKLRCLKRQLELGGGSWWNYCNHGTWILRESNVGKVVWHFTYFMWILDRHFWRVMTMFPFVFRLLNFKNSWLVSVILVLVRFVIYSSTRCMVPLERRRRRRRRMHGLKVARSA